LKDLWAGALARSRPTAGLHLSEPKLKNLRKVLEILNRLGDESRPLQNERLNEALFFKKFENARKNHLVSGVEGHLVAVLAPPLLQDVRQLPPFRKGGRLAPKQASGAFSH